LSSKETCGYNAPLLPVGAYEITTTMPGFKQQVRSGINLVVGQDAVVNLTLEVGAIAEQVTVTEEAPLVNTTTSSTSGVITEQQIKELPLNGRSFDQLITLNTGVSNATSNTLDSGAWNMFSVAGKRPETNRFIINGIDWIGANATGQFITPEGASRQLLGVEAVREFNVLTDTYGARVWKTGRRSDQYRDVFGEQPSPRERLRISAQQRAGRPQLLRSNHWRSSVQTQSIWRVSGRPAQEGQDVPVRNL